VVDWCLSVYHGEGAAAMAYCIMRTRKLKTDGAVAASVKHALRTRETPNADPDRTPGNWSWPGDERAAMARYRDLLPAKVRRNGVRAVELMMTASPEAYKTMDAEAYLRACDEWARKTFGRDHIVQIVHHYDETTPHSSVLVVPIDPKGRLNARHYLGGRAKMQALQDSFAEAVGKTYGLERGVRGSRARHRTIRAYYGSAMAIEAAIQPPKRRLMETDDQYRDRYREQIQPLMERLVDVDARLKRLRYQAERAAEEGRQAGLVAGRLQAADEYRRAISKLVAERERLQADVASYERIMQAAAERENAQDTTAPLQVPQQEPEKQREKSRNRDRGRGMEL